MVGLPGLVSNPDTHENFNDSLTAPSGAIRGSYAAFDSCQEEDRQILDHPHVGVEGRPYHCRTRTSPNANLTSCVFDDISSSSDTSQMLKTCSWCAGAGACRDGDSTVAALSAGVTQ